MSTSGIRPEDLTDEMVRALRDRLIAEQRVLVAGDIEERIRRANEIDRCEYVLRTRAAARKG